MLTAKVRFGRVTFDGTALLLHHKGSIAASTDSRIPVSSITGVTALRGALSPTVVTVWVAGMPNVGHGYSHRFSFRKRHAKQVHAVLAAAGWPL